LIRELQSLCLDVELIKLNPGEGPKDAQKQPVPELAAAD
jgi:hypothetical protein